MKSNDVSRLPHHPSLPPENVYAGKEIRLAERVATTLENYLLTGVRSAQYFRPKSTDIILISGPCSGEDSLGRILAALIAEDPAALTEVELPWGVPWIESRYVESNPSDLDANFFAKSKRVLRTQMAMTMLNPRQHRGPKYVILLRHPLDMRASFYKYLRSCYTFPSDNPPKLEFDELFPSADSFVNVPVTLCQLNTFDPASYEQLISDWYRESRVNPDVLLVFYESLVSNPRREISRINGFLETSSVTLSKKKKAEKAAFQQSDGIILAETRMAAAMAAGRLIDNEPDGASREKKVASKFKRMSVAFKRKAQSIARRSGSSSSGRESSFFTEGDGNEGMGGSAYESPVSTRTVQTFWENRVGLAPPSYEKLYETEMGETYPFPQLSMPKSSAPVGNTMSLQTKLESVTRVMSIAKTRLTNVVKTEITERVKSPTSALRSTRFQAQTDESHNVQFGSEVDAFGRAYADSLLPSQAFAGGDWTTTSSTIRHDFIASDQLALAEPTDQGFSTPADFAAPQSIEVSSMHNGVTSSSVVGKFASQDVMEANMLRSSMRLAGVNKAIVDVVAVKPEALSEML